MKKLQCTVVFFPKNQFCCFMIPHHLNRQKLEVVSYKLALLVTVMTELVHHVFEVVRLLR